MEIFEAAKLVAQCLLHGAFDFWMRRGLAEFIGLVIGVNPTAQTTYDH